MTDLERWRLIVFDWDGTLIDSTDAIVRAAQAAIADLGLPPRASRSIKEIIGLGLREAWERLYPEFEGEYEDFVLRYREHFFASRQQRSELYPGVREVLCELRERGKLLAIATGKSRRGLDKDLERIGLDSLFHLSRTADETDSKPSPRMLQEIMAQLAAHPRETLMVGDTEYDLRMASAAGVAAVGVNWGAHDYERLAGHGALKCFDDLTELPAWLASASE